MSLTQEKFSDIFQHFVDKEIGTYTENKQVVPFPNSPTLNALQQAAESNSLKLSVIFGKAQNTSEDEVTVQCRGSSGEYHIDRITLGNLSLRSDCL